MQATTIETSNGTPRSNPFQKRAGGTVDDVARQWISRPADEAVFSVEELLSRTAKTKAESAEPDGIPWKALNVTATPEGALALRGNRGPVLFNNFSLKQMCSLPAFGSDPEDRSGGIAPHHFLTKLSPDTAALVLNERIQRGVRRKSDASLLVQRGDVDTLRSITTEKYERVWDHELALRIADLCEGGTWQKAEAFKRAGGQAPKHAWGEGKPLPLGWVGDRSMYVCLVDYDGHVTHNGNTYARFFLLSNSEVGAAALKVTFGLMDFACCNFLLWGCHEVYEASFQHVGNVREKWAELSQGFTRQLTADTRQTILDGMNAASRHVLGDTQAEVVAVVQKATTLPKNIVTDAYARAESTPRYGDPNTAWGMLNGLTEASQHAAKNADKRTAIDTKAARLMSLVK